jgi:WD40 repeat protein
VVRVALPVPTGPALGPARVRSPFPTWLVLAAAFALLGGAVAAVWLAGTNHPELWQQLGLSSAPGDGADQETAGTPKDGTADARSPDQPTAPNPDPDKPGPRSHPPKEPGAVETSKPEAPPADAPIGPTGTVLNGHEAVVTCVAFSPDGRFILSGSWDRSIRLWDATTGAPVRRFEARFSRVRLPVAELLAAAPAGPLPLLPVLHQKPQEMDKVTSLAFSADGRRAVSGGYDNLVRLWDVGTGAELRWFEGHTEAISGVAFSPDGRQVLSAGWDNTLRLWDVDTGQEVRRFEGHTRAVTSVAFSPDGRRVLAGGWDHAVYLWDAQTGRSLHRLTGHKDMVNSVAFAPDGHHAVSGSSDNTLRLWDLDTGNVVRVFEGHTGKGCSVAFAPDGRRVVSSSGGQDRSIRVWDVAGGREIHKLEGHTADVWAVAFAPDGNRIISCGEDRTIRLWGRQSPGQGTAGLAP